MPMDRDSSLELSLELPQAHGRGVTPGSKVIGKLNDSDRLGHVLIVQAREHAVKGCPGATGTPKRKTTPGIPASGGHTGAEATPVNFEGDKVWIITSVTFS